MNEAGDPTEYVKPEIRAVRPKTSDIDIHIPGIIIYHSVRKYKDRFVLILMSKQFSYFRPELCEVYARILMPYTSANSS